MFLTESGPAHVCTAAIQEYVMKQKSAGTSLMYARGGNGQTAYYWTGRIIRPMQIELSIQKFDLSSTYLGPWWITLSLAKIG